MYLEYRNYKFCIIKKSKNKNIYFRKQVDGTINVTCPFHLNDKEIYKQLDWFIEKLLKSNNKVSIKVGYKNNSEFMYLGKIYFIKYNFSNAKEIAYLKDKYLIVNIKKEENASKIIDKFIIDEANKILPKLFMHTLAQFEHIDFKPILKIRKMTSKFGVCYPKKQSITLASMLIHYDIECITYVIVHELAHFIQPNHSKKFYHLIEMYLPNYKEIQKKLKHS
ncbi:MAG: M48 family metallopeptidase [Bacilli bacterium]|jgi:predicted metal-dependent hydrolase|nr:M48 family metallopeptidase [Bacilli bacterium]